MSVGITIATRNALFSRSGNRCAICRIELISANDGSNLTNIGKVCHMFPQGKNGPRANSPFSGDINGYENLILLCGNHHDEIDQLPQKYPINRLKEIKVEHELWVYATLQKDTNAFSQGKYCLKILTKMNSGQKLAGLFTGTSGYIFDYTSIEGKDERKTIGYLFDYLKDYAEISSDIRFSDRVDFEQEMEENIGEFDKMGIALFGICRKFNSKELGIFETVTIVAVKDDSPSITNDTMIAMLHKSAFGN